MLWKLKLTRENDGEGAGAAGAAGGDQNGAAAAAAGAAAAAAGNGAGAEGAGAAAAAGGDKGGEPYFPRGLPDTLKGANERETLDKVAKHLADAPKPPESADKYEFKPNDKFKDQLDFTDDPLLPKFRELCHKEGLSNVAFNNVINGVYAQLQELGLVDDPVKIDADLQSLSERGTDPVAKRAEGKARAEAAINGIKGLATRQVLSTDEAAAAIQIASTANGVRAIEKLLKLGRETGAGLGGNGSGAGQGDAEQKRLAAMYPTMAGNG